VFGSFLTLSKHIGWREERRVRLENMAKFRKMETIEERRGEGKMF